MLNLYIPSRNYSNIFNKMRCTTEVSTIRDAFKMDRIAQQLIEVQSGQMSRDKFKTVSLTHFWSECSVDGT